MSITIKNKIIKNTQEISCVPASSIGRASIIIIKRIVVKLNNKVFIINKVRVFDALARV